MALFTVWNMANLVSTLLLDQPIPSFYTLSVAAGKKILFWGLDMYFKSKGGKYYYVYKLSANYRDQKTLAQTLVKDAAVAYLPSPEIIPHYLWNSLPSSITSCALLIFTRTANTFSYTIIQDPSSPALLKDASAQVIESEVERQFQLEQYKFVNVNLNDVLANDDQNLNDLLNDWAEIQINNDNKDENKEDNNKDDNNNNVLEDGENEMVNIDEITVNNQSITIIPNYLTKLQELENKNANNNNNNDENRDENTPINPVEGTANIIIITDDILENNFDKNEVNIPKEINEEIIIKENGTI